VIDPSDVAFIGIILSSMLIVVIVIEYWKYKKKKELEPKNELYKNGEVVVYFEEKTLLLKSGVVVGYMEFKKRLTKNRAEYIIRDTDSGNKVWIESRFVENIPICKELIESRLDKSIKELTVL